MKTLTDSVEGTLLDTITRTYDTLDNLTSETTVGAQSATTTYTYFKDSLPETMTVTGQPQVTYSWDAAHELLGLSTSGQTVTNCSGSATVTVCYDLDGRPTSLNLPNNVIVTYSPPGTSGYDADSRLLGASYVADGNLLGNLTYSYDGDGRILNEGGSLAQVSLPALISGNTYYGTNQLKSWGGSFIRRR